MEQSGLIESYCKILGVTKSCYLNTNKKWTILIQLGQWGVNFSLPPKETEEWLRAGEGNETIKETEETQGRRYAPGGVEGKTQGKECKAE